MIRLPPHLRHRWLRLALLASFTLTSLLLAWLLLGPLSDSNAVGNVTGIVGMFAGLGSLVAALAQLLPPPPRPQNATEVADRLAVTVQEQWSEEVTARQLRDPRVIPLSWAATDRPVAAPAETAIGPQGGRVLRLSLHGRLEGDFPGAAARLAAGYRQVPSGRLVVLGEPGAGKTVLALMLTLGLLADRAPQAPVPVLLSVSSWDPVSESLDDWIVTSLATMYYGGRPQLPRLLLDRRLLLPVLDGLDEIPETARRNAVRALNEACGDGRGVVLTCRSVEYQDVIEGGSPLLRRAPVVEVSPVSLPDAIGYLGEVNWPEGVDWEPVYAHLREHPEGPAATALSTPLALSLARAVYRHCDRDPGELLSMDSRHAVEDHLVDHLIPAAYAPPPGSVPGRTADAWQQEARQAEQWLTFLATYLHEQRERDLAWWLMSRRLLPRSTGLLVGIAFGLVILLFVLTARGAPFRGDEGDWFALMGAAGLVALAWYIAPDRPPGRISLALRGSLHRLRGGFRRGFALTSVGVVVLLSTLGLVFTFYGDWSPSELANFLRVAACAMGVATATGLAFAVHEWLSTPPEHSTHATPADLLRQDRKSSLVGAGLAGAVFGAAAVPVLVLTVSAAYMVFLALTGASKGPWMLDLLVRVTGETSAYDTTLHTLMSTVLPGAVFAVLMFHPRAWPRFVLLRLFLAAKGRLPWRFMRFLTDARKRQLLRQSAGVYQFRHIRLQERLASRSLAEDRVPVLRARIVRRRRFRLAVTGSLLLAISLLVSLLMPKDRSRAVLPTGDVEAMVFGPRGKHALFTFTEDGIVQRWDTRTGKGSSAEEINLQVPHDTGYPSYFMAGHRDGAVLHASDPDGGGTTWRFPWNELPRPTPEFRIDLTTPGDGREVIGSSTGGRYLVLGGSRDPVLWDTRTGEESPIPRALGPNAFDPWVLNDRATLLTTMDHGSTDPVALKNLLSGKHCRIPEGADALGINADGTRFATAPSEGTTTYLWNAQCRKENVSITSHKPVDALALNQEGDGLAITVDGVTRLYDL